MVCGATTLLDDSQVRHGDAGRKKAACDFASQLDGHPQPPLLFCDTLPDCSVILRLSLNYSPTSVAHFYAFAIPLGKYPIYSHIPMMSRRLGAGSSTFSCSCPLVRASLRILLYSGIPYSSVIYLCAKYFLPYLLQLLPGYLQIDNLGGVDAKSSMGHPGRVISPCWTSLGPTFIIALLVFSQVYNRVISEWSIGLFISIWGSSALAIATPTVVVRPDHMPAFQSFFGSTPLQVM